MTKLLMVCTGNICRSQMAQVVTLHLAARAGLARQIQVDSAGTHAGSASLRPDARANAVLSGRGYPVCGSLSRQLTEQDFGRYDLLLAMDLANLDHLQQLCPAVHAYKLRLFLAHAQAVDVREVPDPYFGNLAGFERVLDLCEAGARGLIAGYPTAAGPGSVFF